MTAVVSYTFNGANVRSADGKYHIGFPGANVGQGPGPGNVFGESLPQFLSLKNGAVGRVSTKDLVIDKGRFACRIIFRISAAFDGRQILVGSTKPQFILYLTGSTVAGVKLDGRVKNDKTGWSSFETFKSPVVTPNAWHAADLVYDFDTLGLSLDDTSLGVSAFERVSLAVSDVESMLSIGGPVTPAPPHAPVSESPFSGDIAAFRLFDQIPLAWEKVLDGHRETAQWYLTRKQDSLRNEISLGETTDEALFNSKTGTWEQKCVNGLLMFYSGSSSAFIIHGKPWERFNELSQKEKDDLGHLVSDVIDTTKPGGKKSLFSKGGIYWSDATGAKVVSREIFFDYERTGESGFWGWPSWNQINQHGGTYQAFSNDSRRNPDSMWFHKDGDRRAFGMRNNIYNGYMGGTNGPQVWGWPVEDQHSWLGARAGVEVIECEVSTFFWSEATGAHEVRGDIRAKYLDLGGPDSPLGLPLSNELTGNSPTEKFHYFEKGSIAWFGSKESIVVVRDFDFRVGSLYTQEDEGFGQGQNDLFIRVYIKHGSTQVYQGQHPPPKENGDNNYWNGNSVPVDITMPVTMIADKSPWIVNVQVWEEDDGLGFNDNMLGSWEIMFHAYNGWGFKDTGGLLHSGALQPKVIDITATVNPKISDPASLGPLDKFWVFADRPTPTLAYGQFAQSFVDVDSDGEWTQEQDRKDKYYYDNTYIYLAKFGNDFGMCLEAANAAVGSDTVFGLPLSRFTTWNQQLSWEIGVKQGRYASTGIHRYTYDYSKEFMYAYKNPMREYSHAYGLWTRQDQPIVSIYEPEIKERGFIFPFNFNPNGDFPYAEVLDPRHPGQILRVQFDRNANKFRYRGQAWVDMKGGGAFDPIPRSACFRDTYWTSGRQSRDEGKIMTLVNIALTAATTSASSFNPSSGAAPIDITDSGPEAERLRREGKPLTGIYMKNVLPLPNLTIYSAEGRYRPAAAPSGTIIGGGVVGGIGSVSGSVIHPIDAIYGSRSLLSKRQNNNPNYHSPDFFTSYRGTPQSSSEADSTFRYTIHLGVGKTFSFTGLINQDETMTIRGENLLCSNARFTLGIAKPKVLKLDMLHTHGRTAKDAVQLVLEAQVLQPGSFTLAPTPSLTTLTLSHPPGQRVLGDVKLKVLRWRGGKSVDGDDFSFSLAQAGASAAGVKLVLSPLFGGDSPYIGFSWLGADGGIAKAERLRAKWKLRLPFPFDPSRLGGLVGTDRDWQTVPDPIPDPTGPVVGGIHLGHGGILGGGIDIGHIIRDGIVRHGH